MVWLGMFLKEICKYIECYKVKEKQKKRKKEREKQNKEPSVPSN